MYMGKRVKPKTHPVVSVLLPLHAFPTSGSRQAGRQARLWQGLQPHSLPKLVREGGDRY